MAGKFMTLKKIIIPIITLIVLCSQITGCAIMDSKEMISMIDKGQTISIEVSKPNYDVIIQGTEEKDASWVQLDQLKTYNTGFRQAFDELFNVNIITQNGINGKSGSMYVDESGDRNGNTTLEDAFRNKVFVNYWSDAKVKASLEKIAQQAYTDVGSNATHSIAASLNAYFDIMPDSVNPSSFNAPQSLSREQFYSMVFKSTTGVKEIVVDKEFETAIGGATDYSRYAQEVDNSGFLSIADKSLDASSYKGSISRAEAVYMVVNSNFADKLSEVSGKDKAFSDTKNAGDLALKAGFKTKNAETKEIIAKDRWQSYTLAYMMQHPENGLQEELYKTMVVAKQLDLIGGTESRWDEPISKSEAIQLMVNTQLTKNTLYGYLSEADYGKVNVDKFTISLDKNAAAGVDANGFKYGVDWAEVPQANIAVDPNKVLSSGFTVGQVKVKLELMKSKLTDRSKYPEQDVNELLEKLAADYGTTMNEVNSAKDAPPAVVQPKVETPATVAPKADVEQPAVNKPAAAKPATTKPAVTKPAVTKPADTQPAVTQPENAQPNSSNPSGIRPSSGPGGGTSKPENPLIINAQ